MPVYFCCTGPFFVYNFGVMRTGYGNDVTDTHRAARASVRKVISRGGTAPWIFPSAPDIT